MDQAQIQSQSTPPAAEQQIPTFRKKIGKTTYLVKVHFNSDSKETFEQKIERMIKDEVRFGRMIPDETASGGLTPQV